jgi:iron complex transport system ATP-binding protein
MSDQARDEHAPRLQAQALTLRRRGRSVLDAVSLQLPAHGAVALVGPNGAGKSSLLSLLAGLQRPESGSVQLDGQDIHALSVAERARRVGYMPQRFAPHWDLTLAELMHMRLAGKGDAQDVLAGAGLQDFTRRRWSTLSGGEQARALLATVLATDPPVLLADEPGAALDVGAPPPLELVVMHDLDLALAHFGRVIVLDHGHIALDGAPAELLHAPGLDAVFGVDFERIHAPPETLLRARLRQEN